MFLSLLLSSLLQVGAKGSPGLLLTAAGSWSKETRQGSHQTMQGAQREKQANKNPHFITPTLTSNCTAVPNKHKREINGEL